MTEPSHNSFAISSVKYTDTDGDERRRIVVDVPEELWEDFFKTWSEWNERYKFKPII